MAVVPCGPSEALQQLALELEEDGELSSLAAALERRGEAFAVARRQLRALQRCRAERRAQWAQGLSAAEQSAKALAPALARAQRLVEELQLLLRLAQLRSQRRRQETELRRLSEAPRGSHGRPCGVDG